MNEPAVMMVLLAFHSLSLVVSGKRKGWFKFGTATTPRTNHKNGPDDESDCFAVQGFENCCFDRW